VPEGTGAIKGIAFALAIGVFLDAFLVRMTLVPALMALAGKAAWWLPRWLGRLLPNVDIEGEGLRQHLLDSDWAVRTNQAITAEQIVVGLPGSPIGPFDLGIESGSVVVLTGSAAERRVFAASLAGRLDLVSGRLQVLGAPLPSERSRVLRMVALADVGDNRDNGLTVGELLAERLDLNQPWYGGRSRSRTLDDWLDRLNRALGRAAEQQLRQNTTVSSLPALARAAVIVAAALAERPGVVITDLGDAAPADQLGRSLAHVLADLAPASTTLILAAASASGLPAEPVQGRPLVSLDLNVFSTFDRLSTFDLRGSTERKAVQR
jgi:RND superfamily putative drug exporter